MGGYPACWLGKPDSTNTPIVSEIDRNCNDFTGESGPGTWVATAITR